MHARMQAAMDPDARDDPVFKKGLPWFLLPPSVEGDESMHTFRGQGKRKDGSFRNSGGFLLQVNKVFQASGHHHKFSYKNPGGQPLHVCAYSVVCNVWRVLPRVQLCAYSVVCVCVFSCVQKGSGGNRDSFMFTMSMFSHAYLHDLLMPGWFAEYVTANGRNRKTNFVGKDAVEQLNEYSAKRQQHVDEAWSFLFHEKGIDRGEFDAKCAPMHLHVHAVFANVC